MGSFQERHIFPGTFPNAGKDTVVVTDDVSIFNWTATDSTFTPTRVDTGTAGTATGTVTFSATDATAAANLQTAIRALGGIYADATVVAGATADNMVITVFGGYDITWADSAATGTWTEAGAAGADTAVAGKVTYVRQMPVGKWAAAKKIVAKGFNDASLDISVVDADSKNVFVATAIDTSTASADTPFVKLLTADGVAGEDGAAAANVTGGLFTGPLTVTIATSAPVLARGITPRLTLVIKKDARKPARILKRTTGAMTTQTGTLNLGVPIGKIRRIRLFASLDTTVVPSLTDADGLVVYTKTSSNYTTAVLEQISHEGVDQANNAVADLLDVIAKSPLTIGGSGLGSGTFTYTVWVEA